MSLAAASGHNAATAQLLKSFDAAVLIALAHVSKARNFGGAVTNSYWGNARNLKTQRYIEEVLEPAVRPFATLSDAKRFVFIGDKWRPHCTHVTND